MSWAAADDGGPDVSILDLKGDLGRGAEFSAKHSKPMKVVMTVVVALLFLTRENFRLSTRQLNRVHAAV